MKRIGKVLILSTSILIAAPLTAVTPFSVVKAEANSSLKIKKTTFKTTDRLNLRKSASTKGGIILTIPKGKVVTAIEKKGSWYRVSYSNNNVTKTGWVSGSYLKEYYQNTNITKSYFFTKATTKLYSTPNTKKKAVYTITAKNGLYSTQKVINSIGETWYRITYNGKTLYVNSKSVTKNSFSSFSQTKYKAKKNTYLYQSYGNAYKKLVNIPTETIVQSTKRIGDWYQVSYKGKFGYIYIGDFSLFTDITYEYADTEETYYFTNGTTKLYPTPDSKSAEVITVAANNGFSSTQEVVNSLGETWYRVTYDNKTLYINSRDVSKDFFSPTEMKYKANKDTYVYQSFGNTYQKLVKIPKGTIVSPNKFIGDWYSITYNGTSGYFYIGDFSAYTNLTEQKIPDTTYITTTDLNLRKAADPASTLYMTIPNSKIVIARSKVSNGWYKVTYGGKTGYVSGTYLNEVRTGDPITSRTGYQFVDLRTQSPVTAKQINDYIAKYVNATGKKSVLTDKGQAFINAGKKYGVNALYLASHAILESAYGTSNISLGKNNLFGFGAYDATPFIGAYRFKSVDLCIEYIAREIKATYLNPNNWKYNGAYLGFSTKDMNNKRIDQNSEGMNFYYASDPNWGKSIAKHMENILPFDKSYYNGAKINTTVLSQPSKPEGSDIFPEGIQAIANRSLTLNSNKGINDAVKTINKNTKFMLLEKTNDFWVKVKVDNKIYWTSDIQFVSYSKYLTVQNLGRVTATELNVRSAPSSTIIGQLQLNDFVQLVLNKDGTLVMDSTKTWYKVALANGKLGWVSSQFIARELK